MWMYHSRKGVGLSEAIAELTDSPDRSAAIVASALVDDHLTTVLIGSLHNDPEIMGQMFRGSGPLASFSAKIKLAFLVGLLSQRACNDLHTIRRIRNTFAHELGELSFKSQSVAALAMNLTLPDWYNVGVQIQNPRTGKPVGLSLYEKERDDVSDPRTRFLVTCKLFLSIFTLTPPNVPPKPRV
jgi:hypothetical protein